MIGDIIAGLILALLLYKPILWVARKLVVRGEEVVDEVQKPLKETKHEKSKRADPS